MDEPDGEVELILLESTGYEIVPNQQSTLVEVSDNDEVTIELVGSGGTIQEGSQYTATIRTDSPALYDIPVRLSLQQQGGFEVSGFQSNYILSSGT